MSFKHIPVMPEEVIACLKPQPGKVYVDGTLGGAGHAALICGRIVPNGLLIGLDQDWDAIAWAEKKLAPHKQVVRIFHTDFSKISQVLSQLSLKAVDGILLDLGLSYHQLAGSGRGFSFQRDEPLDMRMNTDKIFTAADLVNGYSQDQLVEIFRTYGEERWSSRIARQIVVQREKKPFSSSLELAEAVKAAVPAKAAHVQRIHPATRIFMALRIVVNQEIERIEKFFSSVDSLLNPGGRLCVISFHSIEDRLVKHRMREFTKSCNCPSSLPVCNCHKVKSMRVLTRKVVKPSASEVERNPMARSAKLRAYERLATKVDEA